MDANVVTAIVMMSGTFVLGFLFYWVLSGLSRDKKEELPKPHSNFEKRISHLKLYQATLESDLKRSKSEIEKLQVERTYMDNLEAENISLKNLHDSIKLHNHPKNQTTPSSSKSRNLKVDRLKKKAR